jgi:cytochrome c-type biogenesis protein
VSGLVIGALALFGAGLAASTSPCVAPLVPGYLAVLGVEPAADGPSRRRVGLTWFVVGAVTTFAFVGAIAAEIGLRGSVATESLQRGAGGLLLVLAVGMVLGQRGRGGRVLAERRLVRRIPASPRLGGLALGVGCAAAWTPCAGPLLGAALTAAAASGSTWRAALLLVAYAAGVVAPFVVLAAIGSAVVAPWARAIGRWYARIAPAIMALVGVALVSRQYERLVSWW